MGTATIMSVDRRAILVLGQVAMVVTSLAVGAESQNTSSAAPCVNTVTDCYLHRREEICQGIYQAWASVRCARYCGFCTDSGTDELCQDTISNCNEYDACDNPQYLVWVAEHCRRFCNLCDGPKTTTATVQSTPKSDPVTHLTTNTTTNTTTTTKLMTSSPTEAKTAPPGTTVTALATSAGAACLDVLPYCSTYSLSACDNSQWALTYCPRFCSLCDKVTSNPTSKVTTASQVTSSPQGAGSGSTVSPSEATTAPPGTTVTAGAACLDVLPYCSTYSLSACDNSQWALTYCPRFCSLCDKVTSKVTTASRMTTSPQGAGSGSTVSPSGAACGDNLASCNLYGRAACSDVTWARTYCPAFCDVCP